MAEKNHLASSVKGALQGSLQGSLHDTRILAVDIARAGSFHFRNPEARFLDDWDFELDESTSDAANLLEAATALRESNVPVAFPTETVYGLGADATRSSAVRGIYAAKQRPADNPLIVHFASLQQLRQLLQPSSTSVGTNGAAKAMTDPIPAIYRPLIERFWPGPLTMILPLPTPSPLAPEVTANLSTFGARMPASELALTLIQLAARPLAAPSANASTRPSPTVATHVHHDLVGRIKLVVDGGACALGVESTVVDGLCVPPAVLRPGSIGIAQLRACTGWADVVPAYVDAAQKTGAPRAPGMKYKHYSPRAKVVLVEYSAKGPREMKAALNTKMLVGVQCLGVIRTRYWQPWMPRTGELEAATNGAAPSATASTPASSASASTQQLDRRLAQIDVRDVHIGPSAASIAHGLFAALRSLDEAGADVILVEGIDPAEHESGDAAAVMNRLRKAAELQVELSPS